MKTTYLTAIISIACLAGAASAPAQTQTCNASVNLRSFVESENREGGWDLIFDASTPSCDASRVSFDFNVEVEGAGRKRELVLKSAEFTTENGQKTAIKVAYQAKPGQPVTGVSGIRVTQCSCAPTNR